MSGSRLLALTTASAVLVAVAISTQPALADGDPASDVLLTQDVFLPQTQIPAALVTQLNALTRRADQARQPMKVALIGAPTDLGSVSALYGQPSKYARFLSLELEFVTKAPVLVVMPQGIGYAQAGKTIPTNRLTGLTVSSAPEGLAQSAIAAINRLEPQLKPPPAPKASVRNQPPTPPPPSRVPAPRQAAPPSPTRNSITGPSKPSDSFVQVIADRFETGASKPVVWAALGIALALVGLGAAGVYLVTEWTARRSPRR